MLVNAALELAPDDPEFQKLVAEEMVFIEAFFRRCIEAGQKDGSIAHTHPAGELADWPAGRNAVYQLAALTIGARLAVDDA